jgi:general secretion pathway protein C
MKHLFKPEVFKAIVGVLVLLLVIKILWVGVQMFFLPTSGVDHVEQKGNKPLYYRVKLTPNKAEAPTVKPQKKPSKNVSGDIKEIKLLAIYNASDVTVVTVEHRSKTKVLSRGDNIKGYVLEGAGSDYATFSKNSKTYKVQLVKGKPSSKSTIKPSNSTPSKAKGKRDTKVEGEIVDAGDRKVVDRSLLNHYAKNMEEIYKNIGIGEVKNGKDLSGFKITFIRKNSPFAKLGVKRDDVIKSINGQEINSYNAAANIYKNIENLENLTLVIERGKEEMELEYEIN